MSDERKIGEYTVCSALYMGEKEYALCENLNDPHGLFYMTCAVTSNDFFEFYSDVLSSADYLEIAGIFADRVKNAIGQQKEKQAEYPREMITADMCESIDDKNLQGEIIVIKADVFRPEFRTQASQIVLCKGGNGAHANARGSAVFCEYLTDYRRTRFERPDVLGILKKEHYPEWINSKIKELDAKKKDHKEKER